MFLALLAAFAMTQADTPAIDPDAPGVVADLTAPPKLNRARAILCSCAKAIAPDYLLTGLVIDAELVLGADMRSAADRQATVFNILSAMKNGAPIELSDRTKIFHGTNTGKCGVRFDYGKQYMVYARKTEDGVYETDYCLMNAAFGSSEPEGGEPENAENAPTPKSE